MEDDMHPAAAIEATGTALYGRWWRAPLARSLQRPGADKPGVDRRLLSRWLDGTPGRPVPAWVPDALVQLAQQEATSRQAAVSSLSNSITEARAA